MGRIIQLFIWIGQFFQNIILVTHYRLTLWYIWPIWEKNCPAINHSLCTKIRIFLRDTSLALRAELHCIYKAALAHFPAGQSATFYTHRTGENMSTASRSSNSRWTPRTHKTPGKTSASTAVRRLALWAERYQKIARLLPLRSCIQSILFHP